MGVDIMAGGDIYLSEMLKALQSDMTNMSSDMQNVVAQMVVVAKNTSYLENLYLATGRRSVITYSSGDDTLDVRKSADVNLITKPSYIVGGNTTAETASKCFRTKDSDSAATGTITIDTTDMVSIKFIPHLNYSSQGSQNVAAAVKIDDVLVPGTDLTAALPYQNITGSEVEIDVSALTEVVLTITVTAGIGFVNGNYDLEQMRAVYAGGDIEHFFVAGSSAIAANKITIASGYEAASFTLLPLTGIAVAGWDCFTWIISGNNAHTRVDVLDASGNVLLEDIKSGEALSELQTLTFYLHFHIQKNGLITPALEAVSYLYLT